jgi:hypothetical protein
MWGRLPEMISATQVVSLDGTTARLDVGNVPIDELLSFRKEHGKLYRRYALALREFVRDARLKDPEDRTAALRERRTEIRDLAVLVRSASRKAWKRGAAFCLGVAGAAWKAHHGDLLGALLAFGAGAAGAEFKRPVDTGTLLLHLRGPREVPVTYSAHTRRARP